MGPTRRAVRNMQAIMVCMFAFAPTAQAAVLNLCWTGGSGYTMTGRMELPDSAMRKSMVREDDVSAFKITGYLNGVRVGSWNMRDRTADTSWALYFDPQSFTFLTAFDLGRQVSQEWNANGNVDDCGTPGFGFNAGNYAQDVCINGVYIEPSSIDPETTLFATFDPVTPDCRSAAALSKSRFGQQRKLIHFDAKE